MFYPVESLKRGGRFYLCWVADSWPLRFATITHRQLWSQDIRKICEDLLEVIKNESGRPINRFSLRLSSQLLRGLVRLYQRKVAVFIGDLCMMNAYVMKVTNKKWTHEASARVTSRAELPVLVLEEQEDEERIVDKIQNSGNMVANVQDITLKEPTVPENHLQLDDGFGELQMQERAMELMMRAGPAAGEQVSALSLLSADETLVRSKLDASSLLLPRMEGISENDISVFKKSMGESLLPAADFDKDIPDMPETRPDLPAPPNDKVVEQHTERREEEQMEPAGEDSAEKRRRDVREFVLDELNESPRPKRRRKNKLIRDKYIKLSSHLMSARVQNVRAELRCEDSADDVMTVLVPGSVYLSRPARAGHRARSNLGYALTRMYIRNLDVADRHHSDDRQLEQALVARPKRSVVPHEARVPAVATEEVAPLVGGELQLEVQPDLSVVPMEIEFMMLPTQIIATSPQHLEHSSKRIRHSGYTTFRISQALKELSAVDTDKENIPENHQAMGDARLTQLLQAEGLADVEAPIEQHTAHLERPLGEHQAANRQTINVDVIAVEHQAVCRRPTDERSETPLGSLDRTKVSLGESDKTTDSRRFIREQWGTLGTMHRVYAAVRAARGGAQLVRVREVLARAPAPPPGLWRLAAARCFASILKLKQHGFIEIIKELGTNEIADIRLGGKVIAR